MAKLAFLGLGVMGYPMAGHLAAAGHDVTVYNRTAQKADDWVAQHGGAMASTPRAAAEGASMVMACVGNDDAFAGMAAGSLFVDHTTVSEAVTKELFSLAAARDIGFVDAPVSGGQAGAENGQLSIMCGGEQAQYDAAEKVITTYAKLCRRIGDSGATMLADEYAHGFAVDWMRKDLAICLQTADENGASLPVTALVDQFYKDVQKMGGGRWDTSSLLKRLTSVG